VRPTLSSTYSRGVSIGALIPLSIYWAWWGHTHDSIYMLILGIVVATLVTMYSAYYRRQLLQRDKQ
jgi:ABC-type nitrate/sulfonate/bicarbonate transport system permease component